MILRRLYELAERERLLDDPAFERLAVPFIVNLGPEGQYLGVEQRRGTVTKPARRKGQTPRTAPDRGREIDVPKAHGNTANRGFARYFVDTLPRVLPLNDEQKSAISRRTFWQQIDRAAAETRDPALLAVQAFGAELARNATLVERVRADVEANDPAPGDRCTFAWHPDGGATILERDAVRSWYRTLFATIASDREAAGSRGICQITGEVGPLPRSHPTRIGGVPGGMPSGVSLVSFDKAAFESYGLDGAANAGIGYRAADGYTRALNALAADKLPGRHRTSLRLGQVLFLFWTREKADTDDLMQLDQPDPEAVARLIESAARGKPALAADPCNFYCLCLSGNAARAIVRDYIEAPLPEVRTNLGHWFRDLRIVDASNGEITATFPLWMLATATVRDADDMPPDLPAALMAAAIRHLPVGDHVLSACLRRIRAESGGRQFAPARMGLIKLILNRKTAEGGSYMSDRLDPTAAAHSEGYACGQLLAFLARCQSPRDYGAGAQILERYFGAASTAPRSVLPVLLRLNRHHIRKVRDENPGFAFNLEQELEERLAPFRRTPGEDPDFPALLSLHEQGRFALGFYHQRAAYRTASAERKAAESNGNV
ncbi:MAG: type I-C CRISPR-associated protein Cas8c/Csd1 [Phycisphaerae bacterium]